MAEQDFFQKRWSDQMKAYVATYKSLQKPKWKLGDISAQVDKGSRKAFWGRLYDEDRIDISYAEFDHYTQTSIAFPEDKRVTTKSWSLHFKIRNLPDRWELVRKDDFKRTKDAEDEVKRRKGIADEDAETEFASERRNEEVEITFHELWETFLSTGEESLLNWLMHHVNWELDFEHIQRIRADSRRLMDAWSEAIDTDYEDVRELLRNYNEIRAKEKIPF